MTVAASLTASLHTQGGEGGVYCCARWQTLFLCVRLLKTRVRWLTPWVPQMAPSTICSDWNIYSSHVSIVWLIKHQGTCLWDLDGISEIKTHSLCYSSDPSNAFSCPLCKCHIHLPVCFWIMDPHSRAPKKKYKPWKWGATARYDTTHTKTILPRRKSVPRSCRQLDHRKTSWRS